LVPASDGFPASGTKEVIALKVTSNLVRVRVRYAIHFNNQFVAAAGKIGEIGPNWQLSYKFQTIESAVPERFPQFLFGRGFLITELSGSLIGLVGLISHYAKKLMVRAFVKQPASALRAPSPMLRTGEGDETDFSL
jgi:hypothetical protein